MRTMVILSLLTFLTLTGCASTAALENAQRHVAACEYQERMERAAGAPQADATGAACAAWRGELAAEQTRHASAERRRDRMAATATLSTASSTAPTPQPVSCSSTVVGSSTFTSCN